MANDVEAGRMVARLVGDVKPYISAMTKAQVFTTKVTRTIDTGLKKVTVLTSTALTALGNAAKRTAVSLGLLGSGMSMLSVGIGGFAAFSVKAFADFDNAMTKSTSIMQVTEQQIIRMRKEAIRLSGQSVQSADQLAESYFFLASAGLNAEQAIAALPVVTEFATAGAFDMALATDLLTDAQTALGLSSKDTAQNMLNMQLLADNLVKAN